MPHSHSEAWISVLNQARLALHEKSGVAEMELEAVLRVSDELDGDLFALLQYQFYTLLLGWLIDHFWED
jgi:hypothetical protein